MSRGLGWVRARRRDDGGGQASTPGLARDGRFGICRGIGENRSSTDFVGLNRSADRFPITLPTPPFPFSQGTRAPTDPAPPQSAPASRQGPPIAGSAFAARHARDHCLRHRRRVGGWVSVCKHAACASPDFLSLPGASPIDFPLPPHASPIPLPKRSTLIHMPHAPPTAT